MSSTEYKSKITWQLDSPFTTNNVPKLSPEHLDTIVSLLSRLIIPIGQYRRDHITPSKGKRSTKSSRKQKSAKQQKILSQRCQTPLVPEISKYVIIGLNSVVRKLESLSNLSRKQSIRSSDLETLENDHKTIVDDASPSNCHFLAVFILSSSMPMAIEDLLQQLIVTASLAHPEYPQTRLVRLSENYHNHLSQCLGIPSASMIGILNGAPLSKGLAEFMTNHVPEIRIPWLEGSSSVQYLPVKINEMENLVASVVKHK
ncbi:hypothetical protein HI914_04910 [Erysiphe necator]|nr:hypothetical protein HI914_04910 [Erysiphe necator]